MENINLDILSLFENKFLLAGLFAMFSSQIVKIFMPLLKGKAPDPMKFFHYGGMPSGHTAFLSSAIFLVAFDKAYGWSHPIFGVAVVIAGVMIYDILRLRPAVEIAYDAATHLKDKGEFKTDKPFGQFRGHSQAEVITGLVWGLIVAFVTQMLWK